MKRPFRCEVIPISEVPRTHERAESARPVVLVVDDEPLVAETLALILSGAGFAARAVHNGSDALDLAQAIRPSLLLTDVHMPGMNGVELALIFTTSFPDCKVLLFSGRATPQDLAPAIEAGVKFPMLAKPLHPTQVIDYISKTLAEPNEPIRARDRSLHPVCLESI
jgi:CheY-like chemotaxis protein